MNHKTLKEIYLHSVSKYRDRPCSSMYQGETVTYGEFAERVESVVAILHDAGLKAGDKVALLSRNMPNWAVGYFAVVTSGMVVVPILSGYTAEDLEKIISHSEAKGLLVSDRFFGDFSDDVIEKLDIVVRLMSLTVISQKISGAPKPAETDPKPDELAALIYTSGTTSAPKGVMLTHANLASQIEMAYDLFPLSREDTFLSILPLPHTYECSIGMLYPFSRGSAVVYLDKPPTPALLMPAMKNVRPTVILSVPLIIEKIYRSQIVARFTKSKFKSKLYSWTIIRKMAHHLMGKRLMQVFGGNLRFFGIGGAKLEPGTERFLREAKFPYAIGYGLTETAPLIAGAVPGKVVYQSTGPVLSRIKVRLDNLNKATGEGEIVVLSPSTMVGYYKNPEATKEVFTDDGWFRTKDLGCIDAKGNLFIRGRLDSMIVGPSGENIYPEEIESVLNTHSLIADSFVRQEQGNLIAMVYFNRTELERKYQDLKEEFNNRMAEIKKEVLTYVNSKVNKSSQVTIVEEQEDEFEKTPTHKIKRFKYSSNNKKGGGEEEPK